MKKVWKVVFLISVILCVAGVICIGVSYFLGGSLDKLYQSKIALPVLEMLSPSNIISSLMALIGA